MELWWLVLTVSLTQSKMPQDESASEGLPRSDVSVGMSVEDCPNVGRCSPLWVAPFSRFQPEICQEYKEQAERRVHFSLLSAADVLWFAASSSFPGFPAMLVCSLEV